MSKTNAAPREGLTLAQLREKLLASGKVTEKSLTKARADLAADPDWQAFKAAQPQPAGR